MMNIFLISYLIIFPLILLAFIILLKEKEQAKISFLDFIQIIVICYVPIINIIIFILNLKLLTIKDINGKN